MKINKKPLKFKKKLNTKNNKKKPTSKRQLLQENFENENHNDELTEDAKESENDSNTDDEIENESNTDDEIENDSNTDDEIENDSNTNNEMENELQDEEVQSNSEDEVISHKQSLTKLKETDPEFYKFLQDNDKKLLDFNISDSEDEDDDEKIHKLDGKLEVASDESDFEPDDDDDKEKSDKIITLKMLKIWQSKLQTDKSNETIGTIIKAFHAALLNVSNPDENEKQIAYYKVKGSAVFNAVIQLCVLELGPAIRRFLGLQTGSKITPHKCKKFIKVKTLLKGYFTDLLKLLSGVSSSNILTVLLKHLHYMSPMLVSYPNITKNLLKKLVNIWSTSTESVRVVAFLCILRITTNHQTNILDSVLKMMYIAYVKNSKFVSLNTLSVINFMRRSLVEMFALDLNVSYQHIFLYIRQLAIHLRNAIVVNKKENLQSVYNWQFINSLRLWGNLFAATCNKPQIQPLIYPFVQVCLGTLKLLPTSQYFPLRFHVTQILMDLTRDTGVFVPVLPFILEVLTIFDFNKKHSRVSMKPLHFTALLRLSKSQLAENGFKDTCIDTVYGQILEYLANQSNSIAFPDISLFCVMQLKLFVKSCSISSYCRKIKQLLEKINQNVEFILKERQTVSFALSDSKLIEAWEKTIKNKGTPLQTFYESWYKIASSKKRKHETENDEIGDFNLPTLKKAKKISEKKSKSNDNEQVTLFPSDSESEAEISFGNDEAVNNDKPKRGKRGGKKIRKVGNAKEVKIEADNNENQDLLQDFNVADW